MNKLILFAILTAILSCSSTDQTKQPGTDSETYYDENIEYETIMTTKYNSQNLAVEDKVFSPYSRGVYLDTIINITKYHYDVNHNLIKRTRINATFNDTTMIFYKYDDSNRMISQIEIENSIDTSVIIGKNYSLMGNNKTIKTTHLAKDPFVRNNRNISFDTSITLGKEKYSDSLLIRRINYSVDNENKEFTDSVVYFYNKENKLVRRYTIGSNGDTVSWKNITYKDGRRVKDDFYIDKGNYLISKLYDSLGYIDIIVNVNFTLGEKDTSFHKCDDKGNVVYSRWK